VKKIHYLELGSREKELSTAEVVKNYLSLLNRFLKNEEDVEEFMNDFVGNDWE
jgi:hypothetical protein